MSGGYRQKCHPPMTKMSYILIHLLIQGYKEKRGTAPAPPPIFSKKRITMKQEKYDQLVKEFGEEKIAFMIDRLDEYADINPKRFKQYACHAAVMRKWIREDQDKKNAQNVKKELPSNTPKNMYPVPSDGENRAWATIIRRNFHKLFIDRLISENGTNLEFTLRDGTSLKFYYSDHKFKELVISQLRKMGANVDGLD